MIVVVQFPHPLGHQRSADIDIIRSHFPHVACGGTDRDNIDWNITHTLWKNSTQEGLMCTCQSANMWVADKMI